MSLKPGPVNFQETWKDLEVDLSKVVRLSGLSKRDWNEIFASVYHMCVAYPDPHTQSLYQSTREFLEKYVEDLYSDVKEHEHDMLRSYHDHWNKYSKGSQYLDELFRYLNNQVTRVRSTQECDVRYGDFASETATLAVGEMSLNIWRHKMIEPLGTQLVSLLLEGYKADRLGQAHSSDIMHGVIQSFYQVEVRRNDSLTLYQEIFERPFLETSNEYYEDCASKLRQEYTCSDYMKKVIAKIDEEEFRCQKYVHHSTLNKLANVCRNCLVFNHIEFLNAECPSMVEAESLADLHNMYQLLKPIKTGLDLMTNQLEQRIKKQGTDIMATLARDANIPSAFVDQMITLHTKYDAIVKDTFGRDQAFVGALDRAMASAINWRPSSKLVSRAPELLSRYCDNLLKKSTKGAGNEQEIDDKLSRTITIFKYIEDKDIFQKFYSRMLAKRLIHQLSVSMEAEESMINRLKQSCGYEFTSKLHRMYTDVGLSSDLNKNFTEALATSGNSLDIGVLIYILQAGAWPLNSNNMSTFAIPKELEEPIQTFESYYKKTHNGRKLTWMHHLCTTELKLNYLPKTYLVTMGVYQMAICLLYNYKQDMALTFEEICQGIQLDSKEVKKQIQSLMDANLLLLVLDDSQGLESYHLNMEYSNKRTKFKITAVVQKESPQEVETTHSAVEEDRRMFIQAAIVRIMKSRQVLKHNTLIQEVISQSRQRFLPSISIIKKCIESLIEKQYMERKMETPDEYVYIA